jgi:hypothetical protein
VVSFLVLPSGFLLGSCGAKPSGSIAEACVPVSSDAAKSSDVLRSFDWGIEGNNWVRAWKSTNIHVTHGTFVELELVEPMFPPGYVSSDAGFPWTRPQLSTNKVLKPARWCGPKQTSVGLQVVTYYYEGVSTGNVTAEAPLTKGWRNPSLGVCEKVKLRCTRLEALKVNVTVT